MEKVSFKSFCWSVGTTSYRTDEFNLNIEKQLKLLKQFRELEENRNEKWKNNPNFQTKYYNFLLQNDFIKGNAKRPDKDAREKTSGLRDIGLLDDERNITEVGLELLNISESKNFSTDNFLEISKDSFLYFKQLLKTTNDINGNMVRPFVVFLYVVNELGYLTNDEFTYLLPLCVNEETTQNIIKCIKANRNGANDIDSIIFSILMTMDNYKQALDLLQTEPISEKLICDIGINRKSAKYDKPYFKLYTLLKQIVFSNANLVLEGYDATRKLVNSIGTSWRKYLFGSTTRSTIVRDGLSVLNDVPILHARNDEEFNEEFFKIMHTFKAKATLSDYFDLNRRYFKLTDIVLFDDGQVKLDVLPSCYVKIIAPNLLGIAFQKTEFLPRNVSLREIAPFLDVDIDMLYQKLGDALGFRVTNKGMAQKAIKDERYARFNRLIDNKFSNDRLISLLGSFKKRNDDEIRG